MSDEPVYQLTFAQRIMVLITVMLGNTIYAASVLISSALLPQLQGAMSATQDEISWTVTFNILATAVFTPMTGWLVGRFGRGPVQFWSLVSFSAATLMCGLSQSLETLVFRLTAAAFVVLTLTFAAGIAFSESIFGRAMRFDHKTVFIVLSWIIFGWLLLGRWRYGWRGRTAFRWTLAGFVMLMLAYPGSRFVLEVVLGRS